MHDSWNKKTHFALGFGVNTVNWAGAGDQVIITPGGMFQEKS